MALTVWTSRRVIGSVAWEDELHHTVIAQVPLASSLHEIPHFVYVWAATTARAQNTVGIRQPHICKRWPGPVLQDETITLETFNLGCLVFDGKRQAHIPKGPHSKVEAAVLRPNKIGPLPR